MNEETHVSMLKVRAIGSPHAQPFHSVDVKVLGQVSQVLHKYDRTP